MKSIYPISSLLKPQKLRSLLSFGVKGYLAEIGWFVASEKKASVDSDNKPIPWFTYSCIDFLQERLHKKHRIFEFGSGNSTRYFAERCAEITSVEHDQTWYESGLRNKPENANLLYCPLDRDGEYCRAAAKSKHAYDLIIVDGRDRVNCCKQSLPSLTSGGVMILDDSERENYQEARDFLLENGFREIPFTGISPGYFFKKATSIFYKSNNCLGI